MSPLSIHNAHTPSQWSLMASHNIWKLKAGDTVIATYCLSVAHQRLLRWKKVVRTFPRPSIRDQKVLRSFLKVLSTFFWLHSC